MSLINRDQNDRAVPPISVRRLTNYEIQVYGAETVPPQTLMVELHSNFTVEGQQQTIAGFYPTYHQEHETVELTEGLNDWSEVGFYIFTSEQDDHGVQWVGDHIRPRFRVPDSWDWPVGVSLSTEIGFQRSAYSTDTWTWEIRPIIDKSIGRWYFAVNPALERTFHGPDVNQGMGFAPSVKVSYDFTRVVSGGFEWYADYGAVRQHLSRARSAATGLPRHGPQRVAGLGDQLRRWYRCHLSHRPSDREGDSRPSNRLGPAFFSRLRQRIPAPAAPARRLNPEITLTKPIMMRRRRRQPPY